MILKKRRTLTETEIRQGSDKILRSLYGLPQYLDAKTVYTYIGCKGEVQTDALILRALRDGKKVAVPKVLGDVMEFYYISGLGELAPGMMGIPEPEPRDENLAVEEDALMIMPGLAFSRTGGRVGFGGGYYDKYLAAHPDLVKAAIAFSWQIFDEVPVDANDIPVPVIVTDEGLIIP